MTTESLKYNAGEWQEIEVVIEPSGKAPKHYGDGIYRFSASLTLPVLMPKRGWTVIKRAKNYVYLKPPAGVSSPFIVNVKIPSKEQAIAIANDLFSQGESLICQIGEWPAYYKHHYVLQSFRILEGNRSELDYTFPPRYDFYMGEHGVWQISLTKTDGEFAFRESVTLRENAKEPSKGSLFDIVLLEGQEIVTELTRYERNVEARKKCIEHYGLNCQACGFNFTQVYGNIGDGVIQVHHIVPISQQGGEYIVDPIRDLRPVCANCHIIIHKRNPPFSIDELSIFLRR